MLRLLRGAGLTIVLLLLGIAGFWFWASSGTRNADEQTLLKSYEAQPKPYTPGDTLSVMTYNVGYLSGMTNNEPVQRDPALYDRNLEEAIDLMRAEDPDLVGFQEIDYDAARSFHVQQLDTLAQRLGYAVAAEAVNWDVRYLPFPYGWPSVHFKKVVSGQAVLSRLPILNHERHVLAKSSRPYLSRVFYIDRLAQVVDVKTGRDTISVVNVHLEAFEQPVRETQAGEVRGIVDSLVATGRPVLLIGDFNAVPDAADDATLQRVVNGLPLRRATPDTIRAGVTPARRATYPADAPDVLIDHIFYMPRHMEALTTRIACGNDDTPPSDHCAVTTAFVLRNSL